MFAEQEDLTTLFLAALPDMSRVVLRDSCPWVLLPLSAAMGLYRWWWGIIEADPGYSGPWLDCEKQLNGLSFRNIFSKNPDIAFVVEYISSRRRPPDRIELANSRVKRPCQFASC